MKFLCENCKAKYQIADEKVAGRTVRMKCRKCSHMIEVEASVTETSVASKFPEGPKVGASTGVSSSKGAVRAAAAGLPPPRPPVAPPPPRPSPATLGRASALPPPRGSTIAGTKPVPRPASPAPAGLAGAFSKAVSTPKEDPSSVSAAMAVLSSSSSTEEWYVGINGVPVGPVRLSELRRKAMGGLVNEESLVWREGFEEWLPLRTFPELCALLKESATTGRTSLTPTPPPTAAMPPNRSVPPPPPRVSGALGGRVSVTPRPPMTAAGRSNVVALSSRRATAEKIDGLSQPAFEEEVKFESDAPPASLSSRQVLSPESELSLDEADDFRRSRFGSRLAESRRAHPAAWLVVLLGGMFLGVAVMVFLLPKTNGRPAVQIVSVMVPTPAPPPTAESEGMTAIGPIEVAAAPATKGGQGAPRGAKPAPEPAAPVSPSLTGLNGLTQGPSAPGGGTTKSGGGGQLTTADYERVVQSHRAFVKRQCWETALATRAPSAPSSARVLATITIAADGRVQSVNASGGDGYPGLASCVQNQVRGWTFPPSDGSTINVPFVFAAQ